MWFTHSASAGDPVVYYRTQHPTPADLRRDAEAARQAQISADAEALMYQQKNFVPRDPWRAVSYNYNGVVTNYAKGGAWVHFAGKVTSVAKEGILIEGWYGEPMDFNNGRTNTLLFIEGFPYQVKLGMQLPVESHFTAIRTEHTPGGSYAGPYLHALHLAYGRVCPIPKNLLVTTNLPAPPPPTVTVSTAQK